MDRDTRPLRIVWFMLHSGYLRHFGSVVRQLDERGHEVHLAFTQLEKDPGDARLATELAAAHERVSVGEAPLRRRHDGWRPLASLARGLVDLGRYAHPRYADSPALRSRMARKLTDHIRTARAVDPVSAWLALRLVRLVQSHTSERVSRTTTGLLGAVERAIPTSREIDAFLRGRRPDAVLVSPVVEFASSQVEYLKSARALGIPSAVAVASWDNLTGKGLIRTIPDRVFVWNEAQAREAVELHGVPPDRVSATGAPKLDEWFERAPSCGYADFARQVGLAPDRPYLLYVCSSAFIAPDEVPFVRAWLARLRSDARPGLRDIGVLVRPHPQNAAQWAGTGVSDLGNAVLWPPEAAQPDAGRARSDFFDSLAHSAAVVGINTSALIEAAILGKSVLVPLPPQFAGTQLGTLHFQHLLVGNGGFVHTSSTLDEHLDQLAAAIDGPGADGERTRRFVGSFVRPHGLDRPATPILADEIEQLARSRAAPGRRGAGATLLRAALTPAVLGAAAAGFVARLARREPPVPERAGPEAPLRYPAARDGAPPDGEGVGSYGAGA